MQGIEPNGGAFSSETDEVSKICHLEQSERSQGNEILRLTPQNDNIFSLAPKKACHCEDERSEDVAIAKSLNINEITTQSTIARNDNNR